MYNNIRNNPILNVSKNCSSLVGLACCFKIRTERKIEYCNEDGNVQLFCTRVIPLKQKFQESIWFYIVFKIANNVHQNEGVVHQHLKNTPRNKTGHYIHLISMRLTREVQDDSARVASGDKNGATALPVDHLSGKSGIRMS